MSRPEDGVREARTLEQIKATYCRPDEPYLRIIALDEQLEQARQERNEYERTLARLEERYRKLQDSCHKAQEAGRAESRQRIANQSADIERLVSDKDKLVGRCEKHKKVIEQYRRGLDGDARELKRLRDEIDDAARQEPKNLGEVRAAVSHAKADAYQRAAQKAKLQHDSSYKCDPCPCLACEIAADIRALIKEGP